MIYWPRFLPPRSQLSPDNAQPRLLVPLYHNYHQDLALHHKRKHLGPTLKVSNPSYCGDNNKFRNHWIWGHLFRLLHTSKDLSWAENQALKVPYFFGYISVPFQCWPILNFWFGKSLGLPHRAFKNVNVNCVIYHYWGWIIGFDLVAVHMIHIWWLSSIWVKLCKSLPRFLSLSSGFPHKLFVKDCQL